MGSAAEWIPASIPERVGRAPHRTVLNKAAIWDVVLGDSIGDGEGGWAIAGVAGLDGALVGGAQAPGPRSSGGV
jgi:hypothetical protein